MSLTSMQTEAKPILNVMRTAGLLASISTFTCAVMEYVTSFFMPGSHETLGVKLSVAPTPRENLRPCPTHCNVALAAQMAMHEVTIGP